MDRPTVTQKLDAFFAAFPIKHFAKGELVLFADDPAPPISYLVKGLVGQYDIAESGNKSTLMIYKPGAFFPMTCAVNNTPNKFFFEALEATQLRQAPAAEVVALLHREPAIMFDLLQRLYRGVDGLLGRVSLLMNGSAYSRLVYELLTSAQRFGVPQADGRVLVKLTETQLAHQAGLARETVSRELQTCVKQGLVSLTKRGLLVHVK